MKKITGLIVLIVIFLLMIENTFSQKPKENVATSLATIMKEIRDEKPITINDKVALSGEPGMMLDLLKTYEKDTSPRVRESALTYGWSIAKDNPDPGIRCEVVSRLVNGLKDPDNLVWQHAGEHLWDFNEKDFTDTTRTVMHQLFMKGDPEREYYIIKVIGVANMQNEMISLGTLLIDESQYETGDHVGKWYGTVGWAARLARARMGSKVDIAHVIEIVDTEPDKSSQVTTLLRHVAYIRQPEAIEFLQRYLESDERLPRVKETAPGTPYHQRALHILTQIILDFPIKEKCIGCYSQSEIELARKWMKNKNNWIHSIRR